MSLSHPQASLSPDPHPVVQTWVRDLAGHTGTGERVSDISAVTKVTACDLVTSPVRTRARARHARVRSHGHKVTSPYLSRELCREKRALALDLGRDLTVTVGHAGHTIKYWGFILGGGAWLAELGVSASRSVPIGRGGGAERATPEGGERGEEDQALTTARWQRVGQSRVGQPRQRVDVSQLSGARAADCGSAGPAAFPLNSRPRGGTPGFRAGAVRGPLSPCFTHAPGVCLPIGSLRKIDVSRRGSGGGALTRDSARCGASNSATTLGRRFGEVKRRAEAAR